MKKCPYCSEEIQDEAIKCKHCNEWLKSERTISSSEACDVQPKPTYKEYRYVCDDCKLEQPSDNFLNGSPICKSCAEKKMQTHDKTDIIVIIKITILVVAFLFVLALYIISKDIIPPSFIAGFIRTTLFFVIMFFLWDKAKKIINKNDRKKE